ncbi:unnamed protein product, partial [Didymodactylos carnosus]
LLLIVVESWTLYNNDSEAWLDEQLGLLTDEELARLARRYENNYDGNAELTHDTRHVKRDALWTTTEVLDCIRRLKH